MGAVTAVTATGALVLALAGSSLADTGSQQVRVTAGDTLSGIAAEHGVAVAALAEANGITDANHIVAGAMITIPTGPRLDHAGAGEAHVVQPGDTLSGIAAEHGVAVAALAGANGIADPDHVVTGRRLVVPNQSGSSGRGRPQALIADPARSRLEPSFDTWAATYAVPPDLLKALCWMESGWQNRVVSITGSVGIGQLTPAAVADVERLLRIDLDATRPGDNIRITARYLRWLLDATAGNVAAAVASYHQGLRSVLETGVRPEIAAYVDAVVALRSRFT